MHKPTLSNSLTTTLLEKELLDSFGSDLVNFLFDYSGPQDLKTRLIDQENSAVKKLIPNKKYNFKDMDFDYTGVKWDQKLMEIVDVAEQRDWETKCNSNDLETAQKWHKLYEQNYVFLKCQHRLRIGTTCKNLKQLCHNRFQLHRRVCHEA